MNQYELQYSVGPVRWFAKKIARRGAISLRHLLTPARPGLSSLRVLTYHRFGDARSSRRDPVCVTASRFSSQMRFLKNSGMAISLDQLQAFLQGRGDVTNGSVLVTIDDAHISAREVAIPILEALGIPATLFVPTGRLGKARHLTATQLREIFQSGFSVGSHGHRHLSMRALSLSDQSEEAKRSKQILEQILGAEVTAFAYPFGTRSDFSEKTADVIRDAGYTMAFTAQHGIVSRDADLSSLARIKIERADSAAMFRAIVGGGLDAWSLVDKNLWRLQRFAQRAEQSL